MSEQTTLNPAIHAAFRRDLARFDEELGACPADDHERVTQLTAAWDHFADQLHLHHHDEESFFWPAFLELGVDQTLLDGLQSEHGAMVAALEAAEQAMAELESDPPSDRARTARLAINELRRVLDDHLAHEERVLDPFSVANAKTKEHKAAKKASRQAHTEGPGTFFTWLLDGADPESVQVIRHEVPRPVLYLMTKIGGRDYNRRIATTWN